MPAWSADVVWGDKEIKIDQFAAEPEGLEHGETATVHLMATAIIRGFRELPQVQWDLKVLSSQGDEVFSRSQSSILAGINADWEAQKSDGTPLDDGVYQIHVRAEIQDEDLVVEKTILFPIGAQGLLIEALTITPNPISFEEQEPGTEGGTFSADILSTESTETATADWTLEIKPVDGAPVRTLAGQVTLTFDPQSEEQQPTHFETFWDGRNEQGELVEEGEYLATLTVDPCRDGSQDCVASADAAFTVAGEFALEIRDEETNELLATSEMESWQEPFPFIGPLAQAYPSELADATFLGPKNNQFLFVEAGQSKSLRVIIRTARMAKPERLTIKASLSKSFPSGINVTLGRYATVDFGGSGYLNRLTLADTTSDNEDQLGIRRGLSQTFSSWDPNSDSRYKGDEYLNYPNWNDSEAFISLLDSRGWSQYGKASWHDVNEVDMDDIDPEDQYVKTVAPTRDALKAAGYEDLVVKIFLDGKLKKKLWLRVKNEASCLYVSTHGGHDDGKIDGIGPWELTGYWGQNLKLLILAGCSVLDIGNVNDELTSFGNKRGHGREWKALLGPGSTCLGYNASAPLAITTPGVPKMDDLIIRRFDALGGFSSDPDTAALAWLKANMAEGGEYLWAQQAEQMAACAITDQHYYFIRHKYKANAAGKVPDGALLTLRQVWKIDRGQWNALNGHESFEKLQSGKTRIPTEYDI